MIIMMWTSFLGNSSGSSLASTGTYMHEQCVCVRTHTHFQTRIKWENSYFQRQTEVSNGTEHRTQTQTHTSKAGWFEQKRKNESVRQGNHFLYMVLEKLNSHTRKCIDRLRHQPNCRQQSTAVHHRSEVCAVQEKPSKPELGETRRHKTTAHKSNLNKLDFIKGKVTLAFVSRV